MRASEIEEIIESIPQLAAYFAGISTSDEIVELDEDNFTIVNTE